MKTKYLLPLALFLIIPCHTQAQESNSPSKYKVIWELAGYKVPGKYLPSASITFEGEISQTPIEGTNLFRVLMYPETYAEDKRAIVLTVEDRRRSIQKIREAYSLANRDEGEKLLHSKLKSMQALYGPATKTGDVWTITQKRATMRLGISSATDGSYLSTDISIESKDLPSDLPALNVAKVESSPYEKIEGAFGLNFFDEIEPKKYEERKLGYMGMDMVWMPAPKPMESFGKNAAVLYTPTTHLIALVEVQTEFLSFGDAKRKFDEIHATFTKKYGPEASRTTEPNFVFSRFVRDQREIILRALPFLNVFAVDITYKDNDAVKLAHMERANAR
jgi:hypothetical protein